MESEEKNKTIGWREWVALPDLNIKKIKAKIDTGARTSTLDARGFEVFEEKGEEFVRFKVLHGTRTKPKQSICTAKVLAHRNVTNSGGQVEERIVILTTIILGDQFKKIEVTLTPRENMKFRMLLGRTAVNDGIKVDVSRSYLTKADRNSTKEPLNKS